MGRIMTNKEGNSGGKKKETETQNFLKFEIKVPIHGLR